MVTGIEDAAKFVVSLEEGVGFIDQEGGLHLLDNAEESGWADVGSHDRALNKFAQDTQQRGFATAFLGRLDADVGADVAELEAIGVDDPKGQGFSGVFWQDDEAGEKRGEGAQQVRRERREARP